MTQPPNEILGVFEAEKGLYFVDSSDSKSLYKVLAMNNGDFLCTCPDFEKNSKTDESYHCKHILAVLGTENYGELVLANQKNGNGRQKLKLAEEFIKSIDGKDFVLYSGLLDLAHQKGLKSLTVEILQFPSKENEHLVICKATAISKSDESFIDFGDASTSNCNPKVAKHLIRMASTRAKARALRDFTNIGITCLEELGDMSEVIGEEPSNGNGKPRQQRAAAPSKPPAERQSPVTPQEETLPAESKQKRTSPAQGEKAPATRSEKTSPAVPAMSEAQRRAVLNLSKRRGIPEEQLNHMAQEQFGSPLDHLTSKDASSFIRTLQQAA